MGFWKKKGDSEQPSFGIPNTTPKITPPLPGISEKVTAQPQLEAWGKKIAEVEERLGSSHGKVRSALGPGTKIQGKLSFDTSVRIDGNLTGQIFSTKALFVGPEGKIDADEIEVAVLVVFGEVYGKSIKATERIEIHGSGRLAGPISTPIFCIVDEGTFSGTCSMGAARASLEVAEDAVLPTQAIQTHSAPVDQAPVEALIELDNMEVEPASLN